MPSEKHQQKLKALETHRQMMKRKLREANQENRLDRMTGLLNRNAFMHDMEDFAQQDVGRVQLAVIDLDNLKWVKDS